MLKYRWFYVLLFVNFIASISIIPMSLIASGAENSTFLIVPIFSIWVLFSLGSLILVIIMSALHLKRAIAFLKSDDKLGLRIGMKRMKLASIPFFLVNFVYFFLLAALLLAASRGFVIFTPIPLLFVMAIGMTYVIMVCTSVYGFCYLLCLKKSNQITNGKLVLHLVTQLIFVLDIIDTMILVLRNRTPEEKITPKMVIRWSLFLLPPLLCVYLFLLPLNPGTAGFGLVNHGLVKALEYGNLECVKEAVQSGANVNKSSFFLGPDGNPLYYSMRNGQRCIPEYLLSAGADPNYIDSHGISILMYTVGAQKDGNGIDYGNVTDNDNYKILLRDKRTDVNLKGKLGYTALDYACRDNGNLQIVNDLIKSGAKITPTTMKCAIEGFAEGFCEASVVKVIFDSLTEQGIDYGIDSKYVAAIEGDTEAISSLIQAGKISEEDILTFRFLAAAFGDANTLQLFINSDTDLNEKLNGGTLLGVACACGNLDVVKYLVNNHVSMDDSILQADSLYEETALTKAIRHNKIQVVEYLLENGARFQTLDDSSQDNNLAIACSTGNLALVRLLIDQGYPMTDEQIFDAMSAAACANNTKVLDYFLTVLDADINMEYWDETVLGNASWSADLSTIKYLVEHGANVNGGAAGIMRPLDRAVMNNRVDLVEYLIRQGADVNAIGSYGEGEGKTTSFLTQAVENGYFDMVKLLVQSGANVNYIEAWPDVKATALDVAKEEGSQHIIDYLEEAQKEK